MQEQSEDEQPKNVRLEVAKGRIIDWAEDNANRMFPDKKRLRKLVEQLKQERGW